MSDPKMKGAKGVKGTMRNGDKLWEKWGEKCSGLVWSWGRDIYWNQCSKYVYKIQDLSGNVMTNCRPHFFSCKGWPSLSHHSHFFLRAYLCSFSSALCVLPWERMGKGGPRWATMDNNGPQWTITCDNNMSWYIIVDLVGSQYILCTLSYVVLKSECAYFQYFSMG